MISIILLSSLLMMASCQCPTIRVPVSSSQQCSSSISELSIDDSNIAEAIENYLACSNSTCNCRSDPSWNRVGYLDMTDSSQSCPSAWRYFTSNSVRGCGRRTSSSGSCDSMTYPTRGTRYSQVCGRIIAYQYGDPEAFDPYSRNIESYYVHGVSLTHGLPGSRTHVWTFANAKHETGGAQYICPCMLSSSSAWPYSVPSFVGNNYFCATGSRNLRSGLITDNPLWDGVGCTGDNTCCQFNQPPWFCTTLPTPTTDNLEVRICGDYDTSNENVFISNLELYVK